MKQFCANGPAALRGNNWRPIKSAPHDGSVVELAETYDKTPRYGIYIWSHQYYLDPRQAPIRRNKAFWLNVNDVTMGLTESDCIYWRPVTKP